MGIRTDLAVEFAADKAGSSRFVTVRKTDTDGITVTDVEILSDSAAKAFGKPKGRYITLEAESDIFDMPNLSRALTREIKGLLKENTESVLTVGIGNKTVTPDALGPKAAEHVRATRHISRPIAAMLGLETAVEVSVLCPGVIGQTGMEAKEIIEGAVERLRPQAVVIIDALAAREVSRLGRTVQLSDSGIAPGSGVGNSRAELSEKTLGVRCIAIGVPTVVDASTLSFDLTGQNLSEHQPLIVTPRDIDRMIERSSAVIAHSLNAAFHSEAVAEKLEAYV